MYKLEEKIFFDGMQQMHGAVAYSGLCTGSAGFAFTGPALDITPVAAGFNERKFEFIKINSAHGFNRAADYLIAHSELNLVHAISRDNAGHLILDDNAAAAFDAVHSELFKSWNGMFADNTHSVDVIISGAGAVSINTPVLFAGGNFSFAAAIDDDCGLELVLDRAYADITITVNGMMSKGAAVRLDAANAARRFYVDAEISVTRININLIDGHAGTGNDGRYAADNFVLNNAIAGKKSADGVSFLTTVFVPVLTPDSCLLTPVSVPILTPDSCLLTPVSVPVLTPDSCLLTPVFKNNKNNIVEALTLRCANVSA